MNEKSASGSVASAAAAEAGAGAAPVAPVVGVAGGGLRLTRPGLPPRRPPERLSHPSTFVLKKSVRSRRFDVIPPCEWPASQNALMLLAPICSVTNDTMFFKYSSSASDQVRVGELGVATTRRY